MQIDPLASFVCQTTENSNNSYWASRLLLFLPCFYLGPTLRFKADSYPHCSLAAYASSWIIYETSEIFWQARPPARSYRFFLNPTAGHFSATCTRQISYRHCKTQTGTVLEKKPALDFLSGSICFDWQLSLWAPNLRWWAVRRAEHPLSSLRDSGDLRAFSVKDVLQPPGSRK